MERGLASDYLIAHLQADLDWIELAGAPYRLGRSPMTALLSMEDVTVRLGKTVALNQVSFAIEPRELVAIVGRSGSGKSTALHCLAGLLPPISGEVGFNGSPIYRWSEKQRSSWRLRNIGLVFQFGDLVPELSLRDNVRLPLLLAGTERNAAGRRTDEIMYRLDIGDVAERRPGEVSGGQMQRAAVARALVHEPAVVLADEPTGALDSIAGQLVLEALITSAREQGSAVVLVTHEARLSSYCERELTTARRDAGRTSDRMIRAFWLGLRLSLGPGKSGRVRVLLMASGSALAAFVVLSALGLASVAGRQLARERAAYPLFDPDASALRGETIYDGWHGRELRRVVLAAQSPDAPAPPGIDWLPGPGEVLLSPALQRLVRQEPLVAQRFPQDRGRRSPKTGSWNLVSSWPTSGSTRRISRRWQRGSPGSAIPSAGSKLDPRAAQMVGLLVALTLVAPVVMFMAACARLSRRHGPTPGRAPAPRLVPGTHGAGERRRDLRPSLLRAASLASPEPSLMRLVDRR